MRAFKSPSPTRRIVWFIFSSGAKIPFAIHKNSGTDNNSTPLNAANITSTACRFAAVNGASRNPTYSIPTAFPKLSRSGR